MSGSTRKEVYTGRFMVTNGCVSFAVNKFLRKSMDYFFNWQQHAGSKPEKFYKTTFFQGEHMMVGLNCLEPGQTQSAHAHEGADKFYFVLAGAGIFTAGDDD